jgi:hypothetical protein
MRPPKKAGGHDGCRKIMQDFDGRMINTRILTHCNFLSNCLSESDGCRITLDEIRHIAGGA